MSMYVWSLFMLGPHQEILRCKTPFLVILKQQFKQKRPHV